MELEHEIATDCLGGTSDEMAETTVRPRRKEGFRLDPPTPWTRTIVLPYRQRCPPMALVVDGVLRGCRPIPGPAAVLYS